MPEHQSKLFAELKRRKVVRVGIAYVVVAWIALQFFDLILDNVDAPRWVMQTVMALLAVGFPVSLVLAWAFEVTPDGIQVAPGRNRAFASLVALVSAGVLGFVGWTLFGSGPSPETVPDAADAPELRVIDSIAVLPFESFSMDRSDEYFADGLADTLLHKLAQLSNLKVIARNSSFQFRGTNKDAREIGEILDVVALLEGSVQRQGDQVRIIAQLIDTADGTHIWSQTFDDSLQNIFELQDRIAQSIMEQLQISISERDLQLALKNGTDIPEAYDFLLRATRLEWNTDREQFDPDTDRMLSLVDSALELDPNYVQAWELRSAIFASALFISLTAERSAQYLKEAMRSAERAVEVAPDYAGGYARLGWAYFRARDVRSAQDNFIKALELDSRQLDAMTGLGLLKVNDDPGFALELFTKKRELDPQDSFVYRQIYFALNALGRLDEGIEVLEDGIERFPEETILQTDIASIYLYDKGRPDQAAQQVSEILGDDSQSMFARRMMVSVWLAVWDVDRADAWLRLLSQKSSDTTYLARYQSVADLLAGDFLSAKTRLEEVEETPKFRFDRSTSIGGACLLIEDADCLIEHADRISEWLDGYLAMGRPYGPGERYRMAAAVLRNAAELPEQRDIDGMQALVDEAEDWPITGGRGFRYVRYLRAMLVSLIGDDEQAVAELMKTLDLPDEGMLHNDIFQLPPDINPVFTRLQGTPGYDAWLTEFAGRREGMRGKLLQMERTGEILSASELLN